MALMSRRSNAHDSSSATPLLSPSGRSIALPPLDVSDGGGGGGGSGARSGSATLVSPSGRNTPLYSSSYGGGFHAIAAARGVGDRDEPEGGSGSMSRISEAGAAQVRGGEGGASR